MGGSRNEAAIRYSLQDSSGILHAVSMPICWFWGDETAKRIWYLKINVKELTLLQSYTLLLGWYDVFFPIRK